MADVVAAVGGPGPVPGILHVDMDAFFAAVEVLDDPGLAGRPLIVGGAGRRGVVASCSYEARRWGIRSAMPSLRARALCPQAVWRPGRHDRYAEVSAEIHAVFNRFTPLVEGISLDEAFLDVRGAARLLGTAPVIAAAVRRAVLDDVGLTCSVGVARTKFVAKLASEAAKPHAGPGGIEPGQGVVVVAPDAELDFLHPHPVTALWGVGPATAGRLRGLGIGTVGDLAAVPGDTLERALGRAAGRHLHDLAMGVDPRAVEPDRAVKSIGHEETYTIDRRDPDGLRREVLRMADAVATRLRGASLTGRTVQLKVRFADFRTITRARTVDGPLRTGPAVCDVAWALLDAVDVAPGVRLLGVSVSSLVADGQLPGEQLRLDLGSAGSAAATGPLPAPPDRTAPSAPTTGPAAATGVRPVTPEPPRWDAATGAIDAVRARFGPTAVGPAVLLAGDG